MEVMALSVRLKEEGAAAVESALKKLRVSSVLTGAALGTGLALALRKLVDATSTAQAAQAQLENSIRATGGAAGQTVEQLNAHASALQAITAFGDEAINKAQARLLSYTSIVGKNFTRATEVVLDYAAAFNTDLVQASEAVGKALNYPTQGLGLLSKQGFIFTEAQKEQIKFFEETNQLAEAQAIIFAELESVTKGAAAAQRNTFGGALKALQNAFGDLFEISREASSGIIAAMEGVTKVLVALKNNIGTVIITVKALAIALTGPWIAKAALGVTAYIAKLRTMELSMARAATAGRTMWTAIGGPIGAIVIGIAALNWAFDKLIGNMEAEIAAKEESSKNDPKYIAAMEIIARRRRQAEAADQSAGLTAKQLSARIADLTRQQEAYKVAIELSRGDTITLNAAQDALEKTTASLAATTETLARVQADAFEKEMTRLDNMQKLAALTPLTRAELASLLTAEQGVANQLAAGNVPLERRIELLERQRGLLDAITGAELQVERERLAAIGRQGGTTAVGIKLPEGAPVVALPPGLARNITQGMTAEVAKQVEVDAIELGNTLRDTMAENLGNGLADGIAAGFERGFATGNIGEGFKALAGTLLSGLGGALVQFGKASLAASTLMAKLKQSMASLNPAAAVAASVAMIALGGTLQGAAQAAFGDRTATRTTAVSPFGTVNGLSPIASQPTQVIFGQTSATTAAGMTPRSSTNVTIIGPDDPKAQRAIEELITKGNRRGTLG